MAETAQTIKKSVEEGKIEGIIDKARVPRLKNNNETFWQNCRIIFFVVKLAKL